MKTFLSFGIALGIFANSAVAQAQTESSVSIWRGPLSVENERPLQAVFGHLPPANPDVLARGAAQWSAQLDIANDLLLPANGPNGESVREDFETQRLKIAYRRGWKESWEIGARTNLTARNGGFMDAAIESYHHLLNLPGNGPDNPVGRGNIPNGRTIFSFQDANGNGINAGNALGLGDTQIWLQKQLSHGKTASALRVGVKLPTGSERKIIGSGSFDASAAFDARYQFARNWALFGNAGGSVFSSSDLPNARRSGLQGGLGLEWKRGRHTSIIAQMDAATRVVKTGNPFADRVPVIGSIGVKRDVGTHGQYWISLSENGDFHNYRAPFFANIAPDSNFSFGYSWNR